MLRLYLGLVIDPLMKPTLLSGGTSINLEATITSVEDAVPFQGAAWDFGSWKQRFSRLNPICSSSATSFAAKKTHRCGEFCCRAFISYLYLPDGSFPEYKG